MQFRCPPLLTPLRFVNRGRHRVIAAVSAVHSLCLEKADVILKCFYNLFGFVDCKS